jgi:hypothetical protein
MLAWLVLGSVGNVGLAVLEAWEPAGFGKGGAVAARLFISH